MATELFTRLEFRVRAQVKHGEEVHVAVGEALDIESRTVDQTVPLITAPAVYPRWMSPDKASGMAYLTGTPLQYRYLIVRGNKIVRWEDIQHNRTVTPTGRVHAVIDDFGVLVDESARSSEEESETAQTPDRIGHSHSSRHRREEVRGNAGTAAEALLGNSGDEHTSQHRVLTAHDNIIIVAYRLPVILRKSASGEWEAEWDNESILAFHQHRFSEPRVQWIGVPNVPVPKEEEDAATAALAPFSCFPVFLEPEVHTNYYDGFCKDTLWPLMHNIIDVYSAKPTRWWNHQKQSDRWHAYTKVNGVFAAKVVERYNEHAIVWVHDYHLLLLPTFLARRLRGANVGLFLHSPFPSSEIFRTLSVRDKLLRGMLAADHIGFHLFEDARHFVTCCKRILGVNHEMKRLGVIGLDYQGRQVSIGATHVGVNAALIDDNLEAASTYAAQWRERFPDKIIISAVDVLDRLKGIPLKLLGFELFLETHPEFKDKVVLLQVGVESTQRLSVTSEQVMEIRRVVRRVNDKFGDVLHFEQRPSMPLTERLGLWMASRVCVNTSIRDCLNLFPFEFLYAHRREGTHGVLVWSEFSGASRVLQGAVPINPWRQRQVAESFFNAITMDREELKARQLVDLPFLERTRAKWAEDVLTEIKGASSEANHQSYQGYGLGLGFRVMGFRAQFTPLNVAGLVTTHRCASRRVFFLDYGGTLPQDEIVYDPLQVQRYRADSAAPLTPGVTQQLRELAADPRNVVFVVSGKERDVLAEVLKGLPEVGLVAEHGFYYRWGSSTGKPAEWNAISEHVDDAWQDLVLSVVQVYTQRTNGTFIVKKRSSILWNFANADSEFGALQAEELHSHLVGTLQTFPVEVIRGKQYVEMRPKNVNKGVICSVLLDMLEGHIPATFGSDSASLRTGPVDFVLAIGDDQADESMFTVLRQRQHKRKEADGSFESFERDSPLPGSGANGTIGANALLAGGGAASQFHRPKGNIFTVTVGKKPSSAQSYVDNAEQVGDVLGSLVKAAAKSKTHRSMTDLRASEARRGAARLRPKRNFPRSEHASPETGGGGAGAAPRLRSLGVARSTTFSSPLSSIPRFASVGQHLNTMPIVPMNPDQDFNSYFKDIEENDEALQF